MRRSEQTNTLWQGLYSTYSVQSCTMLFILFFSNGILQVTLNAPVKRKWNVTGVLDVKHNDSLLHTLNIFSSKAMHGRTVRHDRLIISEAEWYEKALSESFNSLCSQECQNEATALHINFLKHKQYCFPPVPFFSPCMSLLYPPPPFTLPRFVLSPLPSFLEPSHGHYPQFPLLNQSVRHKNGLTLLWLALEQKQHRLTVPQWQTSSFWPIQHQQFPTCIQIRTWQEWSVPPLCYKEF